MPEVYYYTDAEVGIDWPGPDIDRPKSYPEPRFVWYDWPDFETTTNPKQADVFVVRQRLIWLSTEQVYSLPYLSGNERRHVFFDLGSDGARECYRDWPNLPAIFFRGCCTREILHKNPTTIAWPWPVEDLAEQAPSHKDFKYDVVFQGQAPNDMARRAVAAIRNSSLKCHIDVNRQFFAYMNDEEKKQRQASYLETMRKGRLHLVPTSVPAGIVRYRLYEGMTLGLAGVHLCDGCVLPLSDRIDWDGCIIPIKEEYAGRTGEILTDWLMKHTDDDILDMGRYAREVWAHWLDRRRWGEVIGELVRERL
jgi:hypothetical protein